MVGAKLDDTQRPLYERAELAILLPIGSFL